MSNAVYPKWKEAVMQASANSSLTGTVKIALLTSSYIYSAGDQFYSAIASFVIGTPQTLASKTYVAGVFDAADVEYTALTGSAVTSYVVYIDTGVAGTSRLVAFADTSQAGIPFTPDGGDVAIFFNASGLFRL